MPCWNVTTIGVKLGQNVDRARLQTAAEAIGYDVFEQRGTLRLHRDGYECMLCPDADTLQITAAYVDSTKAEEITAELKRVYAAETVKVAAKRFGWRVKDQKVEVKSVKLRLGTGR